MLCKYRGYVGLLANHNLSNTHEIEAQNIRGATQTYLYWGKRDFVGHGGYENHWGHLNHKCFGDHRDY